MADIELSALADGGDLQDADLLLVSRAGTGKRISGSKVVRSTKGFGVTYVAGRWYLPMPGVIPVATTNYAPGYGYFTPIRIPNAVTVDALAARVATAVTGATFSLAIYNAAANGLPGTRIAATGAISAAAAGAISGAISPSQTLQPGLYYLGLSCDNASAAFVGIFAQTATGAALVGYGALSEIDSNAFRYQHRAATTGITWPPDATGATSLVTSGAAEPAIFLRAA